ncbi:MAG: hypothetical protein QW273_02540 [Candidatus Pacearchaeota archaeon]
MFEPKKYRIKMIKSYTPEVKLFRIETNINPLPGQFFQLSILGYGECPLASCSFNKNYVDVLVRKVGNVTSAMFNYLRKGDYVFLRGPYGKGYDLKEIGDKNMILIGGGSGIAPIASLIEYCLQNKKYYERIKVFFGFKNEESILLKDRIKKWSKKIKIKVFIDPQNKKTEYEQGYIQDILKKEEIEESQLFIMCGPELMMKSATDYLVSKGIKERNIFWNMERRMECAIGSCGRCLIQDLYVCKDGPVFSYELLKERLTKEND